MPKIESFEKHSDAYDAWFEKNRDQYEAELEAIRQLLPLPGAEGVEVGVGSGKFAAPLGIKFGVEPSAKLAIKARARGVTVYSGVAEDLPFPDAQFDFVLMVTTLCFVDDVMQSFRQAFRVLKLSGCIIIAFIDRESDMGKQYVAKQGESRFYKEATFFSTHEVMKNLEAAGFRLAGIKQTLIPGMDSGTILNGFGKGAFVVVKGVK